MQIHQLSRQIVSNPDLGTILQEIVTTVAGLAHTDRCKLFSLEPNGKELRLLASCGFAETPASFEMDNSPFGLAIETGSCTVVEGASNWPNLREIAANQAFRSLFSVPIVRQDGTVSGVIAIFFDEPDRPSPDEIEMVKLYANHANIAFENARLHEDMEKRTQQFLAVSEIAATVSGTLNLEEVLKLIVRRAAELLDLKAASVFLLNEEKTELVMVEAYGLSEWCKSLGLCKVGAGMSGRAVSQRKPIQGFDCLRDRRYSEYRSEALREGYRSMLATPLISKKMVLGTLTVYSATPHCFTRDEIQLLTVLANHSAIAIENARLYAEQQRRLTLTELAMYTSLEKLSHQQKFQVVSYHGNKELAILYRLSQAITSAMGVQDILELALSELSNVLSFSVAAVFLYDENKEHLSLAASRNLMHLLPDKTALTIPRGRGLARRVAEQGKPLLVNDADSDPDFKRVFKGVPMGPAMCVPLKVGDEVLGVFILGSHLQGSYAEDRLSFITTFGNQLAVAIVNANHVRRMENMAILEERARIAQDMHDGLAQRLASLNLQTAVVHDLLLSNEVEDAREELVKIMEGIEESNREIREAIQGLRFRSESLPNIRMWLQAYAEDFSRRTGISAVVEAPEKVIVLSSAVQSALLRIFQEALSNVRKHARARNVRIGLKTSANFITLTVEDNGCGFISTSRPTGESSRFGLSVMKERAQQFGGDARVSSVPGRGTKVVIKVPVIGRRQRN